MADRVEVTRETIHYRGQLRPFRDHYYAVGPDGTRFDNPSLVEMRRVLRKRYGDVEIVESWSLEGRMKARAIETQEARAREADATVRYPEGL